MRNGILTSPNRKSYETFSHRFTIEFVSIFQLSVIDHNGRSYWPFRCRKQFVVGSKVNLSPKINPILGTLRTILDSSDVQNGPAVVNIVGSTYLYISIVTACIRRDLCNH